MGRAQVQKAFYRGSATARQAGVSELSSQDMEAAATSSDQIFALFEQFRQAWPKKGWSWDYRLNCVASSFHVDLTRDCEKALLATFADVFDQRSLDRSPEPIQELADTTGGIRSDQRIYVLRSAGRLTPYAMWWPWGDEITISLRIGLTGYVGEADYQRMQMEFQAIG